MLNMRQLVEMLPSGSEQNESLAQLRKQVVALVRQRGYEWREEPFELASGQLTHDYIDGKYAVDSGPRLRLVSRAAVEAANSLGASFDAVGGLTMGADALAHGIALVAGCEWFSVRQKLKSHGRQQWIEGTRLEPGTRVLLVDDVVSTGGSIEKAYSRVTATGASVVGVVALVDRGEWGRRLFTGYGVPYTALVTYHDLDIEPVHGSKLPATAS
jgi:orotate phosphoribosyltransferase